MSRDFLTPVRKLSFSHPLLRSTDTLRVVVQELLELISLRHTNVQRVQLKMTGLISIVTKRHVKEVLHERVDD